MVRNLSFGEVSQSVRIAVPVFKNTVPKFNKFHHRLHYEEKCRLQPQIAYLFLIPSVQFHKNLSSIRPHLVKNITHSKR